MKYSSPLIFIIMQTIKIPVGDKIVTLTYNDWDTDIDIDQVTQIDYANLYGEIVTISAFYNRIGILKAEVDNTFEEYKLDCQVFESQVRKKFVSDRLSIGDKKPSEAVIDDEANTNPDVIKKRKRLAQLKRDCDYVNALYWAIQSKDRKLSVLMKSVTPEEFANSIIEGVVNSFHIKKFEKIL